MWPTDCYLLQRGRHHEGRGGGHEEVAEADDEAARAEDGHAVHTLARPVTEVWQGRNISYSHP